MFFYSNEGQEPPHVHIEHDDCVAKFWLEPVSIATNINFKNHELNRLLHLVVDHQTEWLEEWHERRGRES